MESALRARQKNSLDATPPSVNRLAERRIKASTKTAYGRLSGQLFAKSNAKGILCNTGGGPTGLVDKQQKL